MVLWFHAREHDLTSCLLLLRKLFVWNLLLPAVGIQIRVGGRGGSASDPTKHRCLISF